MGELPRLVMRREGFQDLPRVPIEFGYLVRTYRPGDDRFWSSIIEPTIARDWTPERFAREVLETPQFDPKGLFFVTFGSKGAGTVLAWRSCREGHTGFVDKLAVRELHRGKGLGRLLVVKALEYLRDSGFSACETAVNDSGLAKIKTFLSVGFQPVNRDESDLERWETVMSLLQRPLAQRV